MTKYYIRTSNMHSPVATLKRVPSAQVCRNACTDNVNLNQYCGEMGKKTNNSPKCKKKYIEWEHISRILVFSYSALACADIHNIPSIHHGATFVGLFSYPALACADIVHVALVGMLIDTHRFPTAVKVLQRMRMLGIVCETKRENL